jgi:hypothetical protein
VRPYGIPPFTFARLDRAIFFGGHEKDAPVKPGQGEKEGVLDVIV